MNLDVLDTPVRIMASDSIKKHGEFKNDHEFYAVLLEEIEEAEEELKSLKTTVKSIWGNIRRDEPLNVYAEVVSTTGRRLIFETMQVMSIIEKYKRSNVEKKKEE